MKKGRAPGGKVINMRTNLLFWYAEREIKLAIKEHHPSPSIQSLCGKEVDSATEDYYF